MSIEDVSLPITLQNNTIADADDVMDDFNELATQTNLAIASINGGWIPATGETWVYASADDPTFTFTIAGDKSSIYSAGMKVRLVNSAATKYFIITGVTYGAPKTTVTVYGGTSYNLDNAAITSPYFSLVKNPFGFPLDPSGWTVKVTDTNIYSQVTAVNGTWYNLGALSVTFPIGYWSIQPRILTQVTATSVENIFATLSTANNSESDSEMTVSMQVSGGGQSPNMETFNNKPLTLAAKTVYYVNAKQINGSAATIYFRGDITPTVIRAICAYI